MDDAGTAILVIIGAIAFAIVIIILYNVVSFFVNHPLISGLLIGLGVGVGGTVGFFRIRQWVKEHVKIE